MTSIFIIMVSCHIFTLCWPYNYIHFSVTFLPNRNISTTVDARIACGTETVGALCRTMMYFLTHVSFKTTLPDMLVVDWYYGDAGLGHNYEHNVVSVKQLHCNKISVLALTPFLTRNTLNKHHTILHQNYCHVYL